MDACNLCLLISLLILTAAGPGLKQGQLQFSISPAGLAGEKLFPPWMFLAATEEKTEAATPHRRQEARKKGQVAKSADLNAALVVMAIIAVIYITRGYMGLSILGYVQNIMVREMTSALDASQFIRVYKYTLYACFKIMAPILAMGVFIGLLANFLQVGWVMSSEAITPKLSHINPLEGLKRILSKRALFDFMKTLLKLTVITLVIYDQVKAEYSSLLVLPNMSTGAMISYLVKVTFKVCIVAGMVYLVIAVLDFIFQRWQFAQNLKMSKYEVKTEMKQTEGDPFIKSRMREKQRMFAMRRMIQSVPEATVVITNPTHLAVALKYDENTMQAPQIIAKGAGFIAEKIKEKAAEHNIPVVEDKPLARSLYNGSDIGDYVPVELYRAVAGILAAIYMQRRNRGAGNGPIQ
ncbi:MAG: flagellar biosynthesis protein FlhB [Syntrophomonadaceae bacterium]|nr:flagellar biosynthesis protein FlhB [Syntrophomonadaceae bacterium]